MSIDELRARWQNARDLYQELGPEGHSRLVEAFLRDIEQLEAGEQDKILTLAEASEYSGYSTEHVGRLIRNGKIPNAGRPGAPRVRAGDLPRRSPPRRLAREETGTYNPVTDARSLVSRLRIGGTRGQAQN